jgi:hypothetical protein
MSPGMGYFGHHGICRQAWDMSAPIAINFTPGGPKGLGRLAAARGVWGGGRNGPTGLRQRSCRPPHHVHGVGFRRKGGAWWFMSSPSNQSKYIIL